MSRLVVATCVLLAATGLTSAQEASRAQMEACIHWETVDGTISTRNYCDTPIAVMVMSFDKQKIVRGDVAPGARIDSRVTPPEMVKGMMYTVCPAGYVPNVRFAFKNAETIIKSLYTCQPAGQPDV